MDRAHRSHACARAIVQGPVFSHRRLINTFQVMAVSMVTAALARRCGRCNSSRHSHSDHRKDGGIPVCVCVCVGSAHSGVPYLRWADPADLCDLHTCQQGLQMRARACRARTPGTAPRPLGGGTPVVCVSDQLSVYSKANLAFP